MVNVSKTRRLERRITMKIFELEPERVYTDGTKKYKVDENGILYIHIEISDKWIHSHSSYNSMIESDFTEYIEPVDWSNVKTNDLIEVSYDGEEWYYRYFATYINGTVYTFMNGLKSKDLVYWDYARLINQ